MKTEQISIRIDKATKVKTEKVFKKLGLSPTDAVRMFYRRVAAHRGIPFELRIPNKETRAAMRELERGGGKVFKDTESFYKDLGILQKD
mgnify:CR=1 FL=1